MSEILPALFVAVAGGGLAMALVTHLNNRRTERRAERQGSREADDKRIALIYQGFEELMDRGKDALKACEDQLKSCHDQSLDLGATIVALQAKVRGAASAMEELEVRIAKQKLELADQKRELDG